MVAEEVDGGVGEDFGGGAGFGAFGGERLAEREVTDLDGELVGHTAEEDGLAGVEGAGEGVGAVVPFAGDVGTPAVLAQLVGPGGLVAQILAYAEEGTAGEEHGAGGDADGALEAAHDMGFGEGGAGAYEAIEVGGLDARVAEGADGVGALIVGEQEDEVGGW